MSSAFDGLGTVIAFSIDAVTYTSLAEVAKITGPNIEGKEIDVSNLQSVSGWMEFIPGMINAGELSMELNFLGSLRPAAPPVPRARRLLADHPAGRGYASSWSGSWRRPALRSRTTTRCR
jgi:hypothetical protein